MGSEQSQTQSQSIVDVQDSKYDGYTLPSHVKELITNPDDIQEPIEIRDPNSTLIPKDFEQSMINLINEMKEKTGKNYMILLREIGSNPVEVYPLEKRTGQNWKVTVTNDKFFELNGAYDSVQMIDNKILSLLKNEIYAEGFDCVQSGNKLIFRCKMCKSFGYKASHGSMIFNYVYGNRMHCQTCFKAYEIDHLIWSNVVTHIGSGIIGDNPRGGLCTIKSYGTIEY